MARAIVASKWAIMVAQNSVNVYIFGKSQADLTGADLSGVDLIGGNLGHTNLSGANLSGAILLW